MWPSPTCPPPSTPAPPPAPSLPPSSPACPSPRPSSPPSSVPSCPRPSPPTPARASSPDSSPGLSTRRPSAPATRPAPPSSPPTGAYVVAIARRYRHGGLPLDDLVQEGTVGLLRAVDLFDPARGYKFSTYAVWWIKQALRRALAQQVPLAHVPDNVQMERARLARRAHALHAALGHPPSRVELAAATGLPRARVDTLTAPLPAPVPLDQIIGDGESTTLGDLLPDPAADRPDAMAEAHALAAAVRAALATLDPRARAILVARHGLDGAPRAPCRTSASSSGSPVSACARSRPKHSSACATPPCATGSPTTTPPPPPDTSLPAILWARPRAARGRIDHAPPGDA